MLNKIPLYSPSYFCIHKKYKEMEAGKKIWFITGSASGLGRNIAEAALKAGHTLVATARDITQLNDLTAQYGEQVLPVVLDVNNGLQAKEAVRAAIAHFGRVDVLVNNAGYGDKRPFEQVPADEFRQLVETNFFGVVTLSREVLPHMRQQKSGHIINVSSIGGRFATAGNVAYHASKWAVGGFTEGLALETKPFNVKVTALEPGGMRTNWGKRAFDGSFELIPDYEPSVGANIKALNDYWGNEPIDPEKVAQVVLKVAEAENLPPHILLGGDVHRFVKQLSEKTLEEIDTWKEVSAFCDFANHQPIPQLPGN
jgi:NAD(P)-dependent dehydrogenase (short-subunit alcohol dehydrogenase family)